MLKRNILAFLLGLAALVAVYLPTFILVSVLIKSDLLGKVSKGEMEVVSAPWIILFSATLSLIYMKLLARRGGKNLASFGFKLPTFHQLVFGVVFGVVFALGLQFLSCVLPLGSGPEMGELAHWQLILYFFIGAPIQEEMIFRGLIQSIVEWRAPQAIKLGTLKLSYSALVAAVLFGMVHIATVRLGASWAQACFTVGAAFLLGLGAGWMRSNTGSLLPGVLIHALFNILLG